MCFITINFKFNLFNSYTSTETANLFVVALIVALVFVVMQQCRRFFAPSKGDEGFMTHRRCFYKKPIPEENEESFWKVRNRFFSTA